MKAEVSLERYTTGKHCKGIPDTLNVIHKLGAYPLYNRNKKYQYQNNVHTYEMEHVCSGDNEGAYRRKEGVMTDAVTCLVPFQHP